MITAERKQELMDGLLILLETAGDIGVHESALTQETHDAGVVVELLNARKIKGIETGKGLLLMLAD